MDFPCCYDFQSSLEVLLERVCCVQIIEPNIVLITWKQMALSYSHTNPPANLYIPQFFMSSEQKEQNDQQTMIIDTEKAVLSG